MSIFASLRRFLAETSDIMAHARTGRPAKRRPGPGIARR